MSWREGLAILDEELARLPAPYRAVLIVCCLDGRSRDEAARHLGCSEGRVKGLLERGRELLRQRLAHRGLELGSVLLGAGVTRSATAVSGEACVRVAQGLGAGVSASPAAAALSERVVAAMFVQKLKAVATGAVVLFATAVAAGGALVNRTAAGPEPAPGSSRAEPPVRVLHLPDVPDRYADIDLPAHFKTPTARRFDNTPADNPVTDAGATLGRVLFYDTRLSANNTVSCGSCHVQKNAFVDPNRFSKGFGGKRTDRHAMSLVNLRYHLGGRFFWDARAGSLEEAVLVPIQSTVEMGQDLTRLVEILAKDDKYPELFKKAFGDGKVTRERVAAALAQFLRAMVSYRSKYDEGLAQAASGRDDFPNYTVQENRGKALFVRNCASCHLPGQDAHFGTAASTNNGLDEDHKTSDGGVGDVTLNARQLGLFKSPSLRNVERTAPYMHDGRFDTLEQVIDHYSKEVKPHPNLHPRVRRLNFTDSEKAALVAFLKTLTDQTFLSDPKFSDPFR
ncbi:hypothetical protein FTUN_1439 [Frigoriglobus tundricola]|uniref:Cytochrome c domain-containing protein n=1 Tax=Frigoriglobus tundricola TaxID=2774151 RepID=A0A6M5YIU1_9BACT|nr:hypothetical protein FTUN_1439 [Frigoriglobus tundricola]